MAKKKMKLRLLFAVALMIQMLVVPYHFSAAEIDTSAPSWTVPIDYLALGDSLAAGVTPNNELGKGYADFLAESIQEIGTLKSYNKGFSFPGYKSTDVLNDIQQNVTKDVYGFGYIAKTAELQKSIKDAEIITISAGANDVLPLIKKDPTTGKTTVDQKALVTGLQQVGSNYKAIMTEINQINPDAQVYVMGYYNPFPYMSEDLQPLLKQLLSVLNKTITTGLEGTQAIFVPTGDVIASDYKVYLPNPENIHLSEAGYKKVTELFWPNMLAANPWDTAGSLVANPAGPNSVNLNWQPASDNVAVTSYELYNGEEKLATVNGDVSTYKVENLVDNTTNILSVIAVDQAGNKSIHNPTISVTVAGSTTPTLYTDIAGHGLESYIAQATAVGIVGGYADGTFKPNQNLSRVQAVTMVVRALNLKTDEVAPFGDITNYAVQTKAEINAAYKYGIVKGDYGSFKPTEAVTRAQLALMIERSYKHVMGAPYTSAQKAPYSDLGNYGAETVNAISMLHELNIANGFEGKFMPSNSTTRAQAAKMFVNFISNSKQAK
ncbi:MAG TPA: S-layer homology domain-containing protein [Sporosarcina psychrophila]|uniref:S-layer homology domain-containing protein n=1 Tax=Sporosarcina psychrophila TaxID=1476 RepID=A0A921KF24_SPOPS|nr:S-layer homology domain-containing protein [Sporosarcina psychrophila]